VGIVLRNDQMSEVWDLTIFKYNLKCLQTLTSYESIVFAASRHVTNHYKVECNWHTYHTHVYISVK